MGKDSAIESISRHKYTKYRKAAGGSDPAARKQRGGSDPAAGGSAKAARRQRSGSDPAAAEAPCVATFCPFYLH